MKDRIGLLIALLSVLIFEPAAQAHNHDIEREALVTLSELGSGLYELRTDQSGNSLISHGKDGTLIIDTQMEHLVPALKAAIAEITNKSTVDMILNTHLHRDHVRGNAQFRGQGVPVIAHPNVHKYLVSPRAINLLGRDAPEISEEYLPNIGVADGSVLYVNDHTIHLYHAPNAHTDGDLIVHFVEANVIHAGDLMFSRRYPLIDLDNGGSVEGYIAGMKSILELANSETAIVAGHGPLSSVEDVEASIAMIGEAYSLVKQLEEEGLSLEEIKERNPLSKFSQKWNWAFIDSSRMTTILYYDLTGKLE